MKKSKLDLLFSISDETLLRRVETLKEQIKECEGEIPYNFWCNDCKEKMKKVKNLNLKKGLQNNVYIGVDMATGFSKFATTGVLKYKCLKCGCEYYLCHPDSCTCGGEVEPV